MNTFNPKILEASIRDVASYLSDNQKVDLVLFAMKCLQIDGRSRTVIENAIQSCLQVATLSPENIAKARIIRARARIATGAHLSGQEDLQAALAADPGNHEAKALLHQRSVTVEKLLAPLPQSKERISNEIWREIALYLPRRDLKALLFIPHPVSRIASQLLFWELDLHFSSTAELGGVGDYGRYDDAVMAKPGCEEDARHAQRSADILTRMIVDPSFASSVRILRIFASGSDSGMAFQTGMLTNALPKLINLRSVHLSASSEGILRILQTCSPRLRGLSIQSTDGPADISGFELRHLSHFAFTSSGGNPMSVHNLLNINRNTLRSVALDCPAWTLPIDQLSIRNLTTLHFTGHINATSQAFSEILTHGRQLETLYISCCPLECSTASTQFRTAQHTNALPFLRHFSFIVHSISRRTQDRDLFPAIAEFLRGRKQLRSLQLVADDENTQHATGFEAAIWGVLPSLENLSGLNVSYPVDLAPGLAPWLIPRSLKALSLSMDYMSHHARDPVPFLNQIKQGVPPNLRYVAFAELNLRYPGAVVEHGFPMVRVVRLGTSYYTVPKNVPAGAMASRPSSSSSSSSSSSPSTRNVSALLSTPGSSYGSTTGLHPSSSLAHVVSHHHQHPHSSSTSADPPHHRSSLHHAHAHAHPAPPISLGLNHVSSSSRPPVPHTHAHTPGMELELWPKRRAMYHAAEWLDWLGCDDAIQLGREGTLASGFY